MERPVRSSPQVDPNLASPTGLLGPVSADAALSKLAAAQPAVLRHADSSSGLHEHEQQQHGQHVAAVKHVAEQPFEKRSLVLSPAEIYAEIVHHGAVKATFPWHKLALLAIAAGCYCGFGFTLCLIVGGNAPKQWLEDSPGLFSLLFGAVGFPFSFTIILVCGAELYTSMCAYMMAAWWERKVTMRTCLRMWALSWLWNFVGCAIFVGLTYASGLYHHKDWYIKLLAVKKVSYSWGATLVRGIFANWLVCVATWQANAAQDLTGKAVAIWLPISAFAMLGFEHCIANQFLIPMGIALGAPVSARQFVVSNLIPATIGNWIGGAICMATVYAWVYGSPPQQLAAWWEQRRHRHGLQSDAVAVVTEPNNRGQGREAVKGGVREL